MYSYKATLERVVDGDTVLVKVDLGFTLTQIMRLRLRGIDTPELRGPKRRRGLRAKAYVKGQLENARTLGVRTYKVGRYGRYIADVFYSPRVISYDRIFRRRYCLNDKLVQKKLAVPVPE